VIRIPGRLLVGPAGAGLVLAGALARAGPADVVSARARCSAGSVCRFTVTVRHADEGWDHYADRWQVLASDGEVLATRVLRHPHVEEQPFTRGLGDVAVPPDLERVRIRARDSRHGYGGAEVDVDLERPGRP
jgi:hypothetical protein